MTKVFISHKDSDAAVARTVASRVRRNGFDVYLDSIDPVLVRDGPELAEYLLNRMSECQQLIAVVSISTRNSWWVPWEIGVGSEKGFRMATFCSDQGISLPTYLEKWPVLRSIYDVDTYCTMSRQSDNAIRSATAGLYTDAAVMGVRRNKIADFHKDLRATLSTRRV